MKLIQTKDYLLLIDEEAEIKEGDYILEKELIINIFPDYLTDLDECTKIIAYYPLTKEVKELDLPLLPEHDIEGFRIIQSKQFTLEDMKKAYDIGASDGYRRCEGNNYYPDTDIPNDDNADENFEEDRKEFIQSLSTQQLPKEFIPEYEDVFNKTDSCSILDNNYHTHSKKLKTITNSEGKEVLVGIYKY